MAISISEISITNDPLETPGQCCDPESGAVVDFWGNVRELESDRVIDGINYEVYPAMAEHQMKLLVEKAKAQFFLTGLILRHRVGFVPVGEASLFLRVTSAHRTAAFAASQWIIRELKEKVPIWKRPVFKEQALVREMEMERAATR